MNVSYTILLERISQEQDLRLSWKEIPVIINTDLTTYISCFITYEDDEYLSIVVIDNSGAEYAKILNKSTVLSVEVLYTQMLEVPKDKKGDVIYA